MERIIFLLPDHTRLSCMLNPSSLMMRRRAGLNPRMLGGESITGWNLHDDPILYTGGGTTELILELLFDLSIAGSSLPAEDVRDLTGPLWRLSESASDTQTEPELPVVRLIWGRRWNVPGVVAEIAERLEQFDESGAPRRSLMTMRFLRVNEEVTLPEPAPSLMAGELSALDDLRQDRGTSRRIFDSEPIAVTEGGVAGRADLIASRVYRSESLWRLVLAANGVLEPFQDLTGQPLRLLPRSVLGVDRE